MNERPPAKVTLEDILHLKRAERPAPEFWSTFEKELRTKQLAAIVERRPWWSAFPRQFARFPRWSIPVAAVAAAGVVSFSLLREPSSTEMQVAVAASHVAKVETPAPSPTKETRALASGVSAEPALTVAAVTAAKPEQAAPVAPLAGDEAEGLAVASVEPASPSVARAPSVEATQVVTATIDVAAAVTPVASDEVALTMNDVDVPAGLARTFTARESGRQQLLADISFRESPSGDFDSNADVVRSREHIISRLAERSLYDQMSRFGFQQGGITVKF